MMKSLVLAGARNRRSRPVYSVLRTIITTCKIFGIMIASSLFSDPRLKPWDCASKRWWQSRTE